MGFVPRKVMCRNLRTYNVSLLILGALAALPNGIFVVLFIRFCKKSLKKIKNKLLLSLVTVDLFVGAMGMAFGIVFVTNQPKATYKIFWNTPIVLVHVCFNPFLGSYDPGSSCCHKISFALQIPNDTQKSLQTYGFQLD